MSQKARPVMANHRSSFMLNSVLKILDRNGVFNQVDRGLVQKALLEVASYATEEQDCNPAQVLDELGPQFGLCYSCLKAHPQVSRGGLCAACLDKF
ncbi:hypothetical protein JST97_29960 [bacterium]|nr:hypothetical protein [bacterium]